MIAADERISHSGAAVEVGAEVLRSDGVVDLAEDGEQAVRCE